MNKDGIKDLLINTFCVFFAKNKLDVFIYQLIKFGLIYKMNIWFLTKIY